MTADVHGLYQQIILDHYRHPRNFRAMVEDARRAEGSNPLCGDRITVYVRVTDDVIAEAAFEGVGCAICMASASLMTEMVRGKTLAEIDALSERVRAFVSAPPDSPTADPGAASALAGVRRFPVRVKCALLPWHTLSAAIRGDSPLVSTE